MCETNHIQERIDSVAFDLCNRGGKFFDFAPEILARLLDLCPEQDVWLYEPDPTDPDARLTYATFRIQATNGTIFHMSCLLNDQSEVLEWIGPHDFQLPKTLEPLFLQAIAA
ncbi:MAG: hypothetical protein IPL46_08080 [Saprospiraceae bacterium]|nr:hypothetical protein [Saprospiraceae bacterium]